MNENRSAGKKFIEWLDHGERRMGWTDYQLAKKAKISHSMLSRARNDGIPPKWDALKKIADALDSPPTAAFRAAGLMPPITEDEVDKELVEFIVSRLSQDDRKEGLTYLRFLREQKQKYE
jgi:transcriptional regulator with XRE-family HTH domain